MESKRIDPREWETALGVHRLFRRVTDEVINNYQSTTPNELVEIMITDPYGTTCDGLATLYPCPENVGEYSLRMNAFKGKIEYSTELKDMRGAKGGFIGECASLVEPRIFRDISDAVTETDKRVLPWIEGMHTAMAVPTISVTGSLATTVLFVEDEAIFDAEVIKKNIFLTHATTNIILTWIHRMESVKAANALDEELLTLGRVQRELLPSSLPETDGFDWAVHYHTSTRAGGDYYDFFTLPEDRIGIIIADVSGHGSPAAIVMGMTRLLLHTYPGEVTPPADVLSNVNRLLAGNLLPGHFVTAFYVVLAPDGSLLCSNAGHCRPLLYRAKSGEVEEIDVGSGLPLGVVGVGNFKELGAGLDKGDVLLLYTDGLKEASNSEDEMYGDKGLKDAFKAASDKDADGIKEAILADLDRFIGDEEIDDDLTFIVLKSVG
jgi:sigma-B regulation protein RsbU (phosphoserine phosphatase)